MGAEGAEAKYFVHQEFDSNVTDFEGLSNDNKIVLKSSLAYLDIFIIMKFFQMIYDDNYYLFEDADDFNAFLGDDELICDEDSDVLFKYEDHNIWLKYLTKYYEDFVGDDIENFAGDETENNLGVEIFDLLVFFNKPNPLCYFSKMKNTEQKVYCIDDIIELIL
jgi:hypothetical protein